MSTDTAPTLDPWTAARTRVIDTLLPALTAEGYSVNANFRAITIWRNDLKLGVVDTSDVTPVHGTDQVHGSITFRPNRWRSFRGGKISGTYRVTPEGTINVRGFLRRLTDEHIEQTRLAARAAADERRRTADEAIEATLPTVPGVEVSIYGGQIKLTADCLTPDVAFAVLKLLESVGRK